MSKLTITDDPGLVAQISDHQRVISYRKILIHGYAQVNDLAILRQQVVTLLGGKGHLE